MDKQSFEYTYSPQVRQEVEDIRREYLPREADKMEKLRSLHAVPTKKAQAAAIALGVVGALILGTGMSLCMTDLAPALGSLGMVLGIVIGLVGLAMVAMALPVYQRTLARERKKIAPEILRLSEELLR